MSATHQQDHAILYAEEGSKDDIKADGSPYIAYEQPVGEDESITSADAAFAKQVSAEENHDIKYRSMGWKKCAALLFGEQVCLAIMALPWAYSVLGWVGGLLTTFVFWGFFWLTSYTLWAYLMRHPECKDIVDIGYRIFGKSKIARELTAFMLLANSE